MRTRTIGYTNYATRPMESVSTSKVNLMSDHNNKPHYLGKYSKSSH